MEEGAEGVKVGTVIAMLAGEDEDASEAAEAAPAKAAPTPTSAGAEPVEAPVPTVAPSPSTSSGRADLANSGDRIIASPLAKRIAGQKGIDLAGVTGSGPGGRIVKADVEGTQPAVAAAAATAAPPPVSGPDNDTGSVDELQREGLRVWRPRATLLAMLVFALFFVVVLGVSWKLHDRPVEWKLFVLAASYVFYGWADWMFCLLLAGSTLGNWLVALAVARARGRGPRRRLRLRCPRLHRGLLILSSPILLSFDIILLFLLERRHEIFMH